MIDRIETGAPEGGAESEVLMYQHLLRVAVAACLEIGRRVLPLLEGDSRLAGPAAILRAVQEALEPKHLSHRAAVDRARLARARRDEVKTKLGDLIREFALVILALTRNDYEAILFRRYFRTNYGEVMRVEAVEMAAFAEQLQTKLAEETDPKLIAFREPIRTLRAELVAAESEYTTSAEAEESTFLVAEAQKLEWIHGLTSSRLQATEILYRDKAAIRRIYHAAAPRASAALHEEVAPVASETPESSPAPVAPAATEVAAQGSQGAAS